MAQITNLQRLKDIRSRLRESGIKVIMAYDDRDASIVAIHLLKPSLREVEDALDTAERDLFETIVIHLSVSTWPMARRSS